MWTRAELKEDAKAAFKQNYWRCVLVGLIAIVLMGITGGSAGSNVSDGELKNAFYTTSAETGISVMAIITIILGIMAVSIIISALITVFLRNPLTVGVSRFFYKNSEAPATVGEVGYAFSGGRYLKTVGAMILRGIFIALWSLLLVIPGIIKVYDYYLVGYILADDPDIWAMDALRKSKELMRGHRWNTFVLNVSFLPWMILSAFTFGLLEVFYVMPYMQQTDAQLYRTLKEQNNY